MREIREIVIHATMTDEDLHIRDLDRKHRKAGWNGCGYHFVIPRDGVTEVGRHVDTSGAHVRGFDKYSIGICMVGNVEFTLPQWSALTSLVRSLSVAYPNARVMGHRDCPRTDTTCPTFDVNAWWDNVKLPRFDVV
jgi:N-acetylmuramoyl-L-alanine amidase